MERFPKKSNTCCVVTSSEVVLNFLINFAFIRSIRAVNHYLCVFRLSGIENYLVNKKTRNYRDNYDNELYYYYDSYQTEINKVCFTERFQKHSLVDSITDFEFEDPGSIPLGAKSFCIVQNWWKFLPRGNFMRKTRWWYYFFMKIFVKNRKINFFTYFYLNWCFSRKFHQKSQNLSKNGKFSFFARTPTPFLESGSR